MGKKQNKTSKTHKPNKAMLKDNTRATWRKQKWLNLLSMAGVQIFMQKCGVHLFLFQQTAYFINNNKHYLSIKVCICKCCITRPENQEFARLVSKNKLSSLNKPAFLNATVIPWSEYRLLLSFILLSNYIFQKVLNVSLQQKQKGRQSREKLFVFRCSCLTIVCNKHIRQSQLHCELWGRSQKTVLSFHSGFCGSKLRSPRLYKSFNPLSRHTGQTDIPMLHQPKRENVSQGLRKVSSETKPKNMTTEKNKLLRH